MGWEDRPYFHEHSGPSANPVLRLLRGSMPLGSVFGVRVRVHAIFLLFVGFVLLLGGGAEAGYTLSLRAMAMGMWAAVVFLHELGHCAVARSMRGGAHELVLWPLGGLAPAEPAPRPLPTFLTAAAGPLVNLILCVASAAAVYYLTPTPLMRQETLHAQHVWVSFNPFHPVQRFQWTWSDPAIYFWWSFVINYTLLLFNLLPIYPSDGAQMLQSALWPVVGQFRSMLIATTTGMAGSVMLGVVGLAMGSWGWFVAGLCVWMFYESYQRRMLLRETGPEDWREAIDYGASLFPPPEPRRRKHLSRHIIRKARRIAQQEKFQRDRIDAILAKVSAHGMASLTWLERRTLRKATAQHRRSELELSRFQ